MSNHKKFEEKVHVSYKTWKGQIVHVGEKYMTFTPFNSKALMLIYKENWKDVTVLEVAQTS